MNGLNKSVIILFVNICAICVKCDINDNTIDDSTGGCNLSQELRDEIQSYAPIVNKIISSTTNGKFKGGTYKELGRLVDKFGARVAGTENLENAIDYMLELMKSYGIENVHGENVSIPHWVRGKEHAELVEPRKTDIPVLSLGTSVGTPSDGIEAEVLVVKSFDELRQPNNSKAAAGKIVVFNPDWVSYGVTVQYRSNGATEAAKHGAVAVLIRSVTPFSLATLHTGHQGYDDNVTKIPTACITVEDAHMLQRLQVIPNVETRTVLFLFEARPTHLRVRCFSASARRVSVLLDAPQDSGEKIVIKLRIHSQTLPDVTSRNTVGEIIGESKPERVVLVSGHLDSWDVGVGAMDDGGGAFISWYSLAVIKALGLRAKRTLRAVLWTAEEPGLVGAFAYNASHYEEMKENFTFVMESDEGTFTPMGIQYSTGEQGGCILQEITKLLSSINATQAVYSAGGVGSDIAIWTGSSGFLPGASLLNANERYFWFHHSAADTMDVLDPDALDKATALWASVSYIVADLSVEFPRETSQFYSDSSLLLKRLLKNSIRKH